MSMFVVVDALERQFIEWLVENHAACSQQVQLGIGDDAAILKHDGVLVVAADSIAEGTHFDLEQHSLGQVGHKALAVNLSDLAAMGANPLAALVNFNCPKSFGFSEAKQLFEGIRSTADRFDVQIIGGDTNRWNGKLVVGATLLGSAYPNAKTPLWTMDKARPGDTILVTGSCGGSILKKHIEFDPQVEIARHLIERFSIHAATDISDSLSLDLASMARKSNCGFHIIADAIPVSEAAIGMAHSSEKTVLDHALYDGEDFELILSVSPEESDKILSDPKVGHYISQIGKFTESKSFTIETGNQAEKKALKIKGFEH